MQTNPFSTEAAEYAHLRPTYPDDLFAFLATLVPSRDVAWDCGTGNGQAATHLAAWTYYTPVFGGDIDTIIYRLAHDILGAYWDERVHYVVDEFHDLPFPFKPIEAPSFQTDMVWDMHDLLAYFQTWSSSLKYREANNTNPADLIEDELARAWGDPQQKRDLHFPLYMRLGRVL